MDNNLVQKAKNIRALASDVDGVMTNGLITVDENGLEYKAYNVKDGQGIVNLKNAGIYIAIITARQNGTVQHRFEKLGVTKIYQGQKQKDLALKNFMEEYNLTPDEIAYIGDDLPDICVLKQVAIAACPNDAVQEVKEVCNYICTKNGCEGAVRELCDFIFKNSKCVK